jgi:hypothetical protein
MAEEIKQRTMNTRISHKHDSPGNWEKADATDVSEGFIPCVGELIIYDAEDTDTSVSPRRPNFKIGDGIHNVNDLPFLLPVEIVKDTLSSTISVTLPGYKPHSGTKIKLIISGITGTTAFAKLKINNVEYPIKTFTNVNVNTAWLSSQITTLQFVDSLSCYMVVESESLGKGPVVVGNISTPSAGFHNMDKNASNGQAGLMCKTSDGYNYAIPIRGANGVNVSYASTSKALTISGTTYSAFSGSSAGLVPAHTHATGDPTHFLDCSGNWSSVTSLGNLTVGTPSIPVYFSNGVPTEANRIPTIRTGDDIPDDEVGVDGDLYIVTSSERMPRIYAGTTEPDYSIGVNGDIYIQFG